MAATLSRRRHIYFTVARSLLLDVQLGDVPHIGVLGRVEAEVENFGTGDASLHAQEYRDDRHLLGDCLLYTSDAADE